jgi:hypothetical protein
VLQRYQSEHGVHKVLILENYVLVMLSEKVVGFQHHPVSKAVLIGTRYCSDVENLR